MCHLLETIKIDNGLVCHIDYHNHRFNKSRRDLFGITEKILLQDVIAGKMPEDMSPAPNLAGENSPQVKCRITYDTEIRKVEFLPYQLPENLFLKVIHHDSIDYSYKYADRQLFDQFRKDCQKHEDILIVKQGFVTDISYANIILKEKDEWYTPDTPLLRGTKRQYYLDKLLIRQKPITLEEVYNGEELRIINAMIDLEDAVICRIR